MARNTKKGERDALMKKRRAIRRKLRANQAAKNGPIKRVSKTHPHRRSSTIARSR